MVGERCGFQLVGTQLGDTQPEDTPLAGMAQELGLGTAPQEGGLVRLDMAPQEGGLGRLGIQRPGECSHMEPE